MIEQATLKVRNEMEKENNPYVKVIGDFLIDYINANETEAQKIVADEKKTIMKSIEAMRKEAAKNKVGNMAMLTPEQGYAVVLKYFGIKGKENIKVDYSFNQQKEQKSDFNVELTDFL